MAVLPETTKRCTVKFVTDGDDYNQRIGRSVQFLRQSAGLTQTDLAAALSARGLAFRQQTVVKVESGQRPLRLQEAEAIADALGVEVRQIVSGARYGTDPDPYSSTAIIGSMLRLARESKVVQREFRDAVKKVMSVARDAQEMASAVGHLDEDLPAGLVMNLEAAACADPALWATQEVNSMALSGHFVRPPRRLVPAAEIEDWRTGELRKVRKIHQDLVDG